MQYIALMLAIAIGAGYLIFTFTAEQLSPFVRPRGPRRRRRWALARGLGLAVTVSILVLGIGTAFDGSPIVLGATVIIIIGALVMPAALRFRRPIV